jgi:hypothetical protein
VPSCLITQRSRVQIPPPLPGSPGQGPDRQWRSGLLDLLSVVRPRDRAAQPGRERTSLTENGTFGPHRRPISEARLRRTGPPGRVPLPDSRRRRLRRSLRSRPAHTPAPGAIRHRVVAPSRRTGAGEPAPIAGPPLPPATLASDISMKPARRKPPGGQSGHIPPGASGPGDPGQIPTTAHADSGRWISTSLYMDQHGHSLPTTWLGHSGSRRPSSRRPPKA